MYPIMLSETSLCYVYNRKKNVITWPSPFVHMTVSFHCCNSERFISTVSPIWCYSPRKKYEKLDVEIYSSIVLIVNENITSYIFALEMYIFKYYHTSNTSLVERDLNATFHS